MRNYYYWQQVLFISLIIAISFFIKSCNNKKEEKQPLSGPNWGVISNSSAEIVQSSDVLGWIPQSGHQSAIHFYSSEAYDGTKSLFIQSNEPAFGRWNCKVNVKPWSKYKFTGWIKTENLQNPEGQGVGFSLGAMNLNYQGHTGTEDWVEVSRVFETGNNDSFVLECLFNKGGRSTGKVWFDNMNLELISAEDISTSITVDVAIEKEPMPEYIYGQFIEHLGKCIYGGIWAEMVDDRKFWYAPGDKLSP